MFNKSELLKKEFYKPKDVAKMLGVTSKTIANYTNKNIIAGVRSSTNRRLIPTKSLIDFLDKQNMLLDDTTNNKYDVIYARVSSSGQRKSGDLDRQINNIKDFVINQNPNNLLVLSEVASGLNDNRKQLNKLIKLVQEDKINRIFILYKDRLTRFGFNYIKQICNFHNTEIIIVSSKENNKSNEEELAEDIISIIHSFSGKLYGQRKKIKNKLNEELSESNKPEK